MALTNRLRPLGEGDLPPEYSGYTGEPTQAPPSSQQPRRGEAVAASMLLTSLRALSQRSLVALGNLFVLLTAASAFWLWLTISPNPSVYQIITVSLYGVFILALDWMVLHRR